MVTFTAHQIDIISRGAILLHASQRQDFIRSIERRFCDEKPNDFAVRSAVLNLLAAFGVAARKESLRNNASAAPP
jgi:hypothetical protein